MGYAEYIEQVTERLEATIVQVSETLLEEKYIASACRDYAEALRALEQARLNHMKGEQ